MGHLTYHKWDLIKGTCSNYVNWLFVAAEETESLTDRLHTVKPVLCMYICRLLWSQIPEIFILRASRIFQRDTIRYKEVQRLPKRSECPSSRDFLSKIRVFRESTVADPNHSREVEGGREGGMLSLISETACHPVDYEKCHCCIVASKENVSVGSA